MTHKVMVAGVGNIFFGDDGFGVEVVRRMEHVPLPQGVEVADVGIRGVHLAYELLDGYDGLVLVDALSRGERPGTLFVLEPEVAGEVSVVDGHGIDPNTVLTTLRGLGGHVERVVIVGCEPAAIDEGIGLSPVVEAAVDEAVRLVTAAVRSLCAA